MTRFYLIITAAVVAVLAFAGCDAFKTNESDTSGTVTLQGQVLNADDNNPVPQAFVRVLPFDLLFETDDEGKFDFTVDIDSTMELSVAASKDGFSTDKTDVLALADRVIKVPTLRIFQTVEEAAESGRASNILLKSQSAQSIGVRESGSEEVAQLVFEVADSLGRPVVLDKSVNVRFSLGVQPGGGEFIYPEVAETDNNGQVEVNLSSGTVAGVVQIVAEADVDGRTIRSLPVSISIHGGLPDQAHFSLGPVLYNFPGLRRYGLTDAISVFVGDKFGNPVRQGTSVYFTTTGGLIEGSTATDAQGGGSVSLISANPLPNQGIAHITATTADENQDPVSSMTAVVFSGVPVVTVSPGFAALDQTYHLTVEDPNGNPLTQGTVVSVRVEGTKVKAVGNTSVQLDDTAFIGGLEYENVARGPGITTFTFRAVEDLVLDEDGTPTVETITISVSGSNGSLEIVLGGEGVSKTQGSSPNGVALKHLADGTLVATLNE